MNHPNAIDIVTDFSLITSKNYYYEMFLFGKKHKKFTWVLVILNFPLFFININIKNVIIIIINIISEMTAPIMKMKLFSNHSPTSWF